MSEPLRIFIGYDERQPVAVSVCEHSILEHASKPVSITRLNLNTLPIKRRGLTSFTYSRFLVPYLCDFKGQALFLDADILVRADIAELFDEGPFSKDRTASTDSNVAMVMHEGREKFERASVMLFDTDYCRDLTPKYVESRPCFDYEWAPIPYPLPRAWNHLVGYSAPNPDAKIVHFTAGVPVWDETKNCEFAKEWWDTFKRMNSSVSFEALMGNSVHKERLQMGVK